MSTGMYVYTDSLVINIPYSILAHRHWTLFMDLLAQCYHPVPTYTPIYPVATSICKSMYYRIFHVYQH